MSTSNITPEVSEKVFRQFGRHIPTEDSAIARDDLHQLFTDLAFELTATLPVSRETSLVMTNLQQALHWAIAAVENNDPLDER